VATAALVLALVLVVEGTVYALFPDGMKRAMTIALAQPSGTLRMVGVSAVALGVLLVWLIRG
jgi:uncharacterized protein YjeT (DUF2065 family)